MSLADELKEAIKGDDVKSVCHLLQKDVDVNHVYNLGLTPLHFAALHGSLGAAKVLLCAKANVYAPTSDGARITPRGIAENGNQHEILDLILQVSEGESK